MFHSKGDTTHRTAEIDVLLFPSLHRPINVFFFFLFLPFIYHLKKEEERTKLFFFSHTVPIITAIEFCGFFHQFLVCLNDDDPAPGHQRNRDKRWLVIFFVVVGLTPSDRFVITFYHLKNSFFCFIITQSCLIIFVR